jgi:hypothetical protein
MNAMGGASRMDTTGEAGECGGHVGSLDEDASTAPNGRPSPWLCDP